MASSSNATVPVTICSLDDLKIELPEEIADLLLAQYQADNEAFALDALLKAMKRPPASAVCRVNRIRASKEEAMVALSDVLQEYPHLQVQQHAVLDDVLCIVPFETLQLQMNYDKSLPDEESEVALKLGDNRQGMGWPRTCRVVLCDRFCGEAVLRGSDIFVRGILAADAGIQPGETVAVYADIRSPHETAVSRGLVIERYNRGTCLYLGLGTAACSRSDFFRLSQGVGVVMSKKQANRVGPCLPSLSGILPDKVMLQNLPSILVGHVLDPQPGEVILDMCAAPGGKSGHLASLTINRATILSCDKSRKKILAAKELFQRLGASCITPLVLDATKCVDSDAARGTIIELLESAEVDKDGLKSIAKFPPESFDRILLDPPCSALGLRPKLFVAHISLKQIRKHSLYQENFVKEAVSLLKPGGFVTYSTCTINAEENEGMVRHILQQYPFMKLVPINSNMGRPGLRGAGLNDEQRGKVRRFDPHDENSDSMGFFVALLQKTGSP